MGATSNVGLSSGSGSGCRIVGGERDWRKTMRDVNLKLIVVDEDGGGGMWVWAWAWTWGVL